MLGVLLESRSRRQRRSGGVALSVMAHMAIIGAATVATTHRPAEKPEPRGPEYFHIAPPAPAPKPQPAVSRSAPVAARVSQTSFSVPDALPRIAVPTSIPTSLPDIKAATGPSLDSVLIGSTPRAGTGRQGSGLLDGEDKGGSGEWRGAELLMRIVTNAKPRYPESLRQAGIGGRVLVQFTVDTTGRIDPASVRVLESTHELFTRSVRETLSAFRFKPGEVNGRRVQALAQMPFEFAIR